jgi:HPt (histidine-containing phosphotransfer) domain-containing protein
LSLCAHGNARFRLQTPGQRPGGPKAISYEAISFQSKSDFLSVKRFPISQSVGTILRDEPGLEYLQQTVANEVDDANVLLESVPQVFRDNNMETLAKTSHDSKSVSGLIGMPETSTLAGKIQDDCLNGPHDGLKDTVEKLCSSGGERVGRGTQDRQHPA